jgi:hypothetical protein
MPTDPIVTPVTASGLGFMAIAAVALRVHADANTNTSNKSERLAIIYSSIKPHVGTSPLPAYEATTIVQW